MVGDDAEGDVRVGIHSIGSPGDFFRGGDEIAHEIDIVIRQDTLQNRRDTFESHAGVDMLSGKFRQPSVFVAVILDEDQIPQFNITAAIAVDLADMAKLPLHVAGFGATVQVNLATWPARTRFAHLPEIVFLPKAPNAFERQSADLEPQLRRFVIVAKNRRPEFVLGQAPFLAEQLPGPLDRLGLVVIAKGPVAQHLKKGVVMSVPSDGFQIVVLAAYPQTFL